LKIKLGEIIMNNRLDTEKKIFEKMVLIYCKKKHKYDSACMDCREIIKYGHNKINNCIHGKEKPFCSKCTVHCYEKNIKEKVKDIMIFSGPRIFFYHPIVSLKHFLSSLS